MMTYNGSRYNIYCYHLGSLLLGHQPTYTSTYINRLSFFKTCAKDQVYEELMDLLDGSSDRPITMEDTSELKYMECCMKESIRLFPSVATTQRTLNEDTRMGEHSLPAGTTVAVQIYSVHHNEEHFPDPETFKPELFLPEESSGRHPYATTPSSHSAPDPEIALVLY